jgi:hypothetical protein
MIEVIIADIRPENFEVENDFEDEDNFKVE